VVDSYRLEDVPVFSMTRREMDALMISTCARIPEGRFGQSVFSIVAAMTVVSTAMAGEPNWNPRIYNCSRVAEPVEVDGRLAEWGDVPWTRPFVDIAAGPVPQHQTRAKMMWDDEYFYVAAEMEEPHLWATLRKRDSVIYFDDDFEVFLDADDDTHDYAEIEINVFGTVWDLFITEPYRERGARALHTWDIPGLKTAVETRGTVNDPSDVDDGWSVEIAIPWSVLQESAGAACPPNSGDRWRVNFSRVDWPLQVNGGGYEKRRGSDGKDLPESNWVWSPQRQIAMHEPELWGFVVFQAGDESPDSATHGWGRANGSGRASDPVKSSSSQLDSRLLEIDYARWALRQVYYAQRNYFDAHEEYATSWSALSHSLSLPERALFATWSWPPTLLADRHGYHASIAGPNDSHLVIRDDGWVGSR